MLFVEQFARFGDQPALSFAGGLVLSYAELERCVAALAKQLGATRKLVAVEAERSQAAIVAYLAALRGGHAVALLPAADVSARHDFESDFAPDVVFCRVDGRWRRVDTMAMAGSAPHPDLAVMLATSGSTAKSRFVRLSRQAIHANACSISQYLELDETDRAGLILPIQYSYGLSVLNSHLAVGASVHVATNGAADAGFVEEMRAARCTNIAGVPYSYELLERNGFPVEALPDLRFMTVAGGRIAPELAEKFRSRLVTRGKRFFLMYGQTEATARIAYVPPESLAGNLDSIGIAIPGGTLRLLDDAGHEVTGPEQAGELAYRGPNVMMGYAETRADLARGHEVEELRTGDIATRDRHGFFRIAGRAKRMSKIAGLRISHQAVETTLATRGIVACVTGDDRQLVVAFTSQQAEHEVLDAAMHASGLGALQIAVGKLAALPRLASGKVDLVAAKAMIGATCPVPDATIEASFRRAFYPRAVSRRDSFETMGGDSLIYVQLSMTLERFLGQLPQGWEKMPVAELAGLRRTVSKGRLVDSELPIRAAAILLVVIHHATLWPIPGGAATLMMLVGLGIARFQSAALFDGNRARLLKSLAINLAVYAPIVVAFCLARGEMLWPSILLVGNLGLTGPERMVPYLYWFVEAYAQLILLTAALFSAPSVRRAVAGQPFEWGMALLAIAVAAKLAAPYVWPIGGLSIFTLPDVLYLAVLGWCAHFAAGRRQKLLLAGVAATVLPFMAWWGGNWTGSWVKFSLVLAAVLLVLAAPRLWIPTWSAKLVLPIGAASYHIYLFHRILPDLLLPQPDPATAQPLAATIAVVSGVAVGLAVRALQGRLMAYLAQREARPALAPAE